MRQIEVSINVDDKRDLTRWFREPKDVDVFLGLIEQLFDHEFREGQRLSDQEMKAIIDAL